MTMQLTMQSLGQKHSCEFMYQNNDCYLINSLANELSLLSRR